MNKPWLIVFFFLIGCHSRREKDNFETVNEGELVNKHFFFSLPYQNSSGNAAVIAVIINGKRKRFMIDTGSPLVISKSLQKELQLPNLMNSTTEDSNGDTTGLDIVRVTDLLIGELQFSEIPAVVLDLNHSGSCDTIDGFIGSNLLRLLIIQFNKPEQKIYFGDCIDSFKLAPGTSFSNMSLNYEQSSPVISVRLNGTIYDSTLYDSGDRALYTISKKKFGDYNKDGSFNNRIAAIGTGLSAQGIVKKNTDSLSNFVLRVDNISIGHNSIKNLYVKPTYAGRSRTGRGLWDFGLVTMDYPRKKFYFTPYQKEVQAKSPVNFGFEYQEMNGKLVITVVWNNSQAFMYGLKPGLEIVQFGSFSPGDIPICDWDIYIKREEVQDTLISIKYVDEKGETKQCNLSKSEFNY